jgi:hypoxanthine phosphoribosyltransferase
VRTIRIKEKIFREFITQGEIETRVSDVCAELFEKFQRQKPVFIVVLRGAFMFASDLLKQYNAPCEIEFVKIASYEGLSSSGKINIELPLNEHKIKGRNIIILEDIVDSGLTMLHFMEYLQTLAPASVTLVSFLIKPENLEKDVKVDIAGFTIPNLFVIGYGLDFDGEGRNLPAVYQLEPDAVIS